jgi:uncharacterized BrkB/YihY/UPF0761 family membrane protein
LKSGFSALPLLGLSSIKSLAIGAFFQISSSKIPSIFGAFSTLTALMVFRVMFSVFLLVPRKNRQKKSE